ncbi:MAG: pyridoxal 5'-phosphate synthase glutaminase subunit PdxT [Clostridiales bacterium]|nr:pyridoxal 5'-phosphate synthase glutaminase subunit PdxT [Clostridiales bacterium]
MTGVLAVQGDFLEHEKMLEALGEECFEIRQAKDLEKPFDRLVFPGGESTVQSRLIDDLKLYDTLKEKIESGVPTLATCAGLILLSETVDGSEGFFKTLPVRTKRNAYGRQTGSFFTTGSFGELEEVPMSFIRAPYIEEAGDGVEILSVTDSNITAVKYKNQLAMAYHPELCEDLRIFKTFLEM